MPGPYTREVESIVLKAAAELARPKSNASQAEIEWRIGLARAKITPQQPIAMSGYGQRVSDGVLDDLCAKAMVIEDRNQQRVLLVTADLLFFRAPFAAPGWEICARAASWATAIPATFV